MAQSFDQFKECMRIEAALDLEALDFAVIQPLKDLQAWYSRQSVVTQKFIDFFTTGLGAVALMKFLSKAVGRSMTALTEAALELLGAALVGAALGLTIAAMVRCNVQDIDPSL